jgi:hypothetical protein
MFRGGRHNSTQIGAPGKFKLPQAEYFSNRDGVAKLSTMAFGETISRWRVASSRILRLEAGDELVAQPDLDRVRMIEELTRPSDGVIVADAVDLLMLFDGAVSIQKHEMVESHVRSPE